jgi:hypothetical protein
MYTPISRAEGGAQRRGKTMHRNPKLFQFKPPARTTGNKQLLQALRAFAKQEGPPLTTNRYDAWPKRPCNANCLAARFRGWTNALRQAGLPTPRTFTNADLIEALESAWQKLGRRPGKRALLRLAGIDERQYRKWGGLLKASQALAAYHKGDLSRAQLLNPKPQKPAPTLSQNLRYQILQRDKKCRLCGRSADDGVKLEVDHILPVSKGGKNTPENLQALCRDCNSGKSAKLAA